jgi:CBS domain-containing protein
LEIEALKLVSVKEIMQTDVKTARPDLSVKEFAEKMSRFNTGSIIVGQERGRHVIGGRRQLDGDTQYQKNPNRSQPYARWHCNSNGLDRKKSNIRPASERDLTRD